MELQILPALKLSEDQRQHFFVARPHTPSGAISELFTPHSRGRTKAHSASREALHNGCRSGD